ncbi:hypothetical protein MVEN_02595800 [Mycena venus]|uniref:Uncharacterized protein n=1 Tax=Mycena venus TaxID=2733690 RepID=A0A8H6TZ46_9AGAR|nr:hypothetical protein MVEN_02595800 [Mycena venus]
MSRDIDIAQADQLSAPTSDADYHWVEGMSKNGKPFRIGHLKTNCKHSAETSELASGAALIDGKTNYRLDPVWAVGSENDNVTGLSPITKYKLWKRDGWIYTYRLEVYCERAVSLVFYDGEPDYYSKTALWEGWWTLDYNSTSPNILEVDISND